MAQENSVPEREQNDATAPQDARKFPSGGYAAPTTPISAAKTEVVAEVAAKAAATAVDATAAPEVDARAAFESEGPEFDPVAPVAPPPVAPPASEAIPVAPKAAVAPAVALAPPTADEYDRMIARRAASAPVDSGRPHPSTIPIALRPTPQGPHYPSKG